jgi:hypothetical protein
MRRAQLPQQLLVARRNRIEQLVAQLLGCKRRRRRTKPIEDPHRGINDDTRGAAVLFSAHVRLDGDGTADVGSGEQRQQHDERTLRKLRFGFKTVGLED